MLFSGCLHSAFRNVQQAALECTKSVGAAIYLERDGPYAEVLPVTLLRVADEMEKANGERISLIQARGSLDPCLCCDQFSCQPSACSSMLKAVGSDGTPSAGEAIRSMCQQAVRASATLCGEVDVEDDEGGEGSQREMDACAPDKYMVMATPIVSEEERAERSEMGELKAGALAVWGAESYSASDEQVSLSFSDPR